MKAHIFNLHNLSSAEGAAQIESRLQAQNFLQATLSFATHSLQVMAPEDLSCRDVYKQVQSATAAIDPTIIVDNCVHEGGQKKTLYLEGLHCADCAQKIENAAARLPGVEQAVLSFATQSLSLTLSDPQIWDTLPEAVQQVADKIEPGARVHTRKPSHQEEDHHHHEGEFTRKDLFRIGLGALFFLSGLLIHPGPTATLVLYILAYGLVGANVLLDAARNLRHGDVFNEQFLMVIASLGAFVIGEYPEAVAVMLFYNAGEWAQHRAVDNSRNSIKALVDIQPEYANRIVKGAIEQVHPNQVAVGEQILVKVGESIPLDSRVRKGNSTLDTSAITGESLPRDVAPGDEALSGCINLSGVLTLEVEKRYEDSAVAIILEMVENAGANKAPTEKFITRFARYYTPVVVFSALALAFLPPLLLPGAALSTWVYRALIFLVASCPCALVISIPLSFYAGIGGASKKGILMKGGNYIESLSKASIVAFDKTGTLTQGRFEVIQTKLLGTLSEEALLEHTAIIEEHSNHPIARAFDPYLPKNPQVESIQEHAGYGLEAILQGEVHLVGNARLMEIHQISVPPEESLGTTVYVAIDGKLEGLFVLQDVLKEGVAEAATKLKAQGVEILAMLTGDKPATAHAIGNAIGIDQVYPSLLPHEKVSTLEKLEQTNPTKGTVVYVGDGINDAPVLTMADVGIAMGKYGSDAAIEAADVVITTDEISRIPDALNISKKTMAIATQNIIFALGIKGVVLVLGALGFATMWAAVFADVGVALLCILNATRVLRG